MAIFKNVSSQKISVFAWDTSANAEKTGDAANITARISKDGAAVAQSNDVNPTELDPTYAPGVYVFDMTQAETNADLITLFAKSGTANIKLEPVIIYTLPTWQASQVAQTGDNYARLGAPAGASVSADIAAIYAAVDTEIATLITNVATILAAVDTEIGAIKAKTDNLPVDPADASDIAASFGSIVSTLATIAGYIDTEITSIAASIAALNNLSTAQVKTQIVDALNVDTYAEPGQEAPPATTTLAKKIGWLYKLARNRKTQTSTTLSVYGDNGTTVDAKATISDDGTTYDHSELGTGP